MDRADRKENPIWPEFVGLDGQGAGKTSNDYFAYLVSATEVMPIMFAGAGVEGARDATELKSKGNAWCILWSGAVGKTSDYIISGNLPFMVTRNLKGASISTDRVFALDDFNANIKPFGQKRIVVIYRDSSAHVFLSQSLASEHGARVFFGALSATNTTLETLAIARTADE